MMKLNFCAIGVHQWSNATNISGFHEDGIENLFFRNAIQTGEQLCTRDNCDAFRHVARRLRSESDTATGAWFRIAEDRKNEIANAPKFPSGAEPLTPSYGLTY